MAEKKWDIEADYFFKKLEFPTEGKEFSVWFCKQETKYYYLWGVFSLLVTFGSSQYWSIPLLSFSMLGITFLSVIGTFILLCMFESFDSKRYNLFVNLFPTSFFKRKKMLKIIAKWKEIMRDKENQYLLINITKYYSIMEKDNNKKAILSKNVEVLTQEFMDENYVSPKVLAIIFKIHELYYKKTYLEGLKEFKPNLKEDISVKEKEINSDFDFNK